MNNFTLIWSFRNRINLLKRSIQSADATCPKHINFCLVDASSNEETIKELRLFCNTIADRKIRICESSYRSSLSEAWNLGMMLADTRYVVFSSSDVHFLSQLWYKIVDNGIDRQSQYMLLENHSVFLIDKKIIPEIGWFDESYGLGPHFDCDYMIKASEKGINVEVVPYGGSYSHNSEEQESSDFHNDLPGTDRVAKEIPDRLPMNTKLNEDVFKSKWESGWPGWTPQGTPHPPTHITQVKRKSSEVDPHPLWTKKIYENTFIGR